MNRFLKDTLDLLSIILGTAICLILSGMILKILYIPFRFGWNLY